MRQYTTRRKSFFSLTLLFLPLLIFSQTKKHNTSPVKDKGYVNNTSLGVLIGSKGDYRPNITSFIMEHNYRLNKYFSAGLVTGIEWFDVTVAPIGPNVKLTIPKINSNIYIGLSGGYAIALQELETVEYYKINETNGGGFFNSDLGYNFPDMGGFNIFVSAGYRYHEFSFIREDWWLEEVERKTTYNRFSIKAGVRIY